MNSSYENRVEWNPSMMLEVSLSEPDDFLKIRETLSRIGVASRKDKTLYQSCNILHKLGKYYICSFKELFALDGKYCSLTLNDVQRRNRVAFLLQDWGLLSIVAPDNFQDVAPLNQIKVIAFKEKDEWTLVQKYTIGKKTPQTEEETN